MNLQQVKIYRMTHIENIPHILNCGITHKNSNNNNPSFITIGDISLIDTRSSKRIIVDNGNSLNFNAPTIVLGDYIPFYFGVKMPMLYVMQNGGNFVEHATPPKDIVYLVCPIIKIIESDNVFYFTYGHATDNLTTFYDSSKVLELTTIIDWSSVGASYWGGHENLNIKRKKQAEFLVSDDLEPEYLIGIGCYNELAKRKLMGMGVDETKIKIISSAYY